MYRKSDFESKTCFHEVADMPRVDHRDARRIRHTT